MIVDDHKDSARALSRLLRQEGHTVITAHTVAGAMALVVGQRPIDVLLSDIGLPDGDGCELLRQLRAFYGGRDIAALAISGLGEESLVKRCLEAGYRQVLMKPLTFEQVLEAVRAVAPAPGPPAAAEQAAATD